LYALPLALPLHIRAPPGLPAGPRAALIVGVLRVSFHPADALLVNMPSAADVPNRSIAARVPVDTSWRLVPLPRTPALSCLSWFHRVLLRVDLPSSGSRSRTAISSALASFSSIATVGLIRPVSIRWTDENVTPARSASPLTDSPRRSRHSRSRISTG